MAKVQIIAVILTLISVFSAGRQIGACELTNIELRDDLKDIASQLGLHVGLTPPSSDEDFGNDVILKSERYDIQLTPVRDNGSAAIISGQTEGGPIITIYLAAEYSVPVRVLG